MAQMELLQDIQIRKAKGQDNIYYLNDGGGLRLKITPTNSKIWEFRYTFNGKSRKTTFKTYPTVTLKEARTKRQEYQTLITICIRRNNSDSQPIYIRTLCRS